MHYYETKLYQTVREWYFRYIGIPLAYRYNQRYDILDSMQSIKYIIDNRCSVSRFGDGEFYVMMGLGNGFQTPDPKLAARLMEVMSANDAPNHMIGIPLPLKDVSMLVDGWPRFFWEHYSCRYSNFLHKQISTGRTYLNTQFSRFYNENWDKSKCPAHIALIKKIWDNKDIVIVEGEKTRSGIGNDLYDNARTIQRILGPATNAFERYEEMLGAITQNASKDKLILMSYGMSATVLAYDLAKLGYWAIDLGHLDIEYEWFKIGATNQHQAIPNKFTNEAPEGHDVGECNDPLYLSQIICRIC